jgi:hypothetical protein
MNFYRIFIYSIIVVKLIYSFFLIRYFYYKYKHNKNPFDLDYYNKFANIQKIKSKFEFIITFSMAFLLIILFYPHKITKAIDSETKQLLCIFGIIIIIKELGLLR